MKISLNKIIGLSAFALGLGLSSNPALAAYGTINNDAWLRSTDGQPIFAHSGYLAKFGGTYYFYGQEYVGSTQYYQSGTVNGTNGANFVGTNVYTSTDLINWAPKVVAFNGGGYITGTDWGGRCWGVLFNASTSKYVMWMKYNGANGEGCLCLTATSPLGPFTVDHLQTSVTNVFSTPPIPGDSKFFYAADGTPYLACSDSHGRQRAYVAPLSSDYKTINPVVQIATWAQGQEGDTAFYVPATGKYYFITSETNGWSYSFAYQVSSSSLTSGYSADAVLSGTQPSNTYWAQTLQATGIQGSSGTVNMLLCDRWGLFNSNYKTAGHGTGYNVWEPLTITSSSISFNPLQTWQLDAAAGTWTQGGPVTYQAENAALAGGTVVESSSAGFHGTGYANFPTTGGTCQFNNADGVGGGARTLVIRYALISGTRTGTLTINGTSQNITFSSTGAWTTWATMNVAVTLTSGTTNTIKFASTGQDLANIDEITIQ